MAVDASNYLYVADVGSHAVRTISSAPIFSIQPQDQTAAIGANVVLNSFAYGQPDPSYRWYFRGTLIAGATAPAYVINNAQSTHSGQYWVVASNASGLVTSRVATLTVNTPAPPASPPSAGGGGGGAPSLWFFAAVAIAAAARLPAFRARRH
jgi:hypothetical protein